MGVEVQYKSKEFVMVTVEAVALCVTRSGDALVFRGPAGKPECVTIGVPGHWQDPTHWDVDRVADAFLDFLDAYASGDCEEGHSQFCETFGPAWEQVLRSYDDLREIFPERF
jgi:hypothetical protein